MVINNDFSGSGNTAFTHTAGNNSRVRVRKSRRYIRKKKFHRAIAAVAVCVLIAALVVFLVFVILELKEGI